MTDPAAFNRLADTLMQEGHSKLDYELGEAGISMQQDPADDFIAVWLDGKVVAHVVPVASSEHYQWMTRERDDEPGRSHRR